jgi:hypothetical protein
LLVGQVQTSVFSASTALRGRRTRRASATASFPAAVRLAAGRAGRSRSATRPWCRRCSPVAAPLSPAVPGRPSSSCRRTRPTRSRPRRGCDSRSLAWRRPTAGSARGRSRHWRCRPRRGRSARRPPFLVAVPEPRRQLSRFVTVTAITASVLIDLPYNVHESRCPLRGVRAGRRSRCRSVYWIMDGYPVERVVSGSYASWALATLP